MGILNLYKKAGQTPLECIEEFRRAHPEYAGQPLSYAGRLDPLASGVLIVLAGEESNRMRERYLNLPKRYSFDVLFGVETDTHDLLGIVKLGRGPDASNVNSNSKVSKAADLTPAILEKAFQKLRGKRIQKYPAYSSKTVSGKPLFQWAREGKIAEIEVPSHEIEIYGIDLVELRQIGAAELKKSIEAAVGSVRGDFRQKEISQKWQEFFLSMPRVTGFSTTRICIECSSGTYVRVLADELGKELGQPALAMNILRESVGDYTIDKITQ